jgi:hypothetical protein
VLAIHSIILFIGGFLIAQPYSTASGIDSTIKNIRMGESAPNNASPIKRDRVFLKKSTVRRL